MMTPLNIDIISDVSCPWCLIGYHSLKAAIDESGLTDSVHLNWKAFELNPDMPKAGKTYLDYGREKYGRMPEQAAASLVNVKRRAAAVGFDIDFPDPPRIYNTFDAHRLLFWAKEFGLQTELKLGFFRLFFQDHGNLSDHEDLLKRVGDVGLDVKKAKEILNSNAYEDKVKSELDFARQNNINSVPTYIFNKKYQISGGQPKAIFMNVLDEVRKQAS